jgi:hypothetical protein
VAQTVTLAMHVTKGSRILVDGVIVRVVRRQKWNSQRVKIAIEDCGHGMPTDGIDCRIFRCFDHVEVL